MHRLSAVIAAFLAAAALAAQPPQFSNAVRSFITVDAPVVALTNARVVDGTGAPANERQTLVLRGGDIAALGDAASVAVPDGAHVVDLAGKTVIPGLVMALERAFVRAGGLLIAGTDPTGSGGVVPGFANQRQIELLVEAGFSPVEAISIGTLNGAKYLGRAGRIGSLAVGKQGDLVVINGDPSTDISAIRNVEMVFKQGVGYDPKKLIQAVSGRVGLW